MADHTDSTEAAMESQRNNEDDPLITERLLGEVGEKLLTLEDRMSLCDRVLEDLQELQGIVLKRDLQDAPVPTQK